MYQELLEVLYLKKTGGILGVLSTQKLDAETMVPVYQS